MLRAARAFFNNVPDLPGSIQKLISENAEYKKKADEFARQKAARLAQTLKESGETVNGINLIRIKQVADADIDQNMLRDAAMMIQKEIENTVIAAAIESEGKPSLMLMYSNDLVAKGRNAGKDIREAAKLIQGGGGGQPGLATAGGRNVNGLADALDKLVELATA